VFGKSVKETGNESTLFRRYGVSSGRYPGKCTSLEDLNIQIHGYATQGFLYTTNNNWNTTTSSDGSPAGTEAVVL
jgi:hypothetical protein